MYKQKLASCEATENIYASHETKEKNVTEDKDEVLWGTHKPTEEKCPLDTVEESSRRKPLSK